MRSRSFVFPATRSVSLLALAILAWALPAAAALPAHAQTMEVSTPGVRDRVSVTVHFDAPPSPMTRLEKQNNRLIVDVTNAEISGKFAPLIPKEGIVAGVLTQSFAAGANRTVRILISLRDAARYGVVPRGNDLVISLEPGPYGVIDDASSPRPSKAVTPEVTRIDDVRYEHSRDSERVVVRAYPPPARVSSHRTALGTRIVLEGATLPSQLSRIMDVGAYAGRIAKIAAFQDPENPDRMILDIEHERQTRHRVLRESGALAFEFTSDDAQPTSVTGIARDGGIAAKFVRCTQTNFPSACPQSRTALDWSARPTK